MAEYQPKIKDLIKDIEDNFFNFDLLLLSRTRKDEIIEPINGVITGEIPKWIKGCLLQNGSGAYKFGDVTLNHVFDGMALLHRYNIDNGRATYQCRFIKSEAYESIKNENRMRFSELGTTSMKNEGFLKKLYAALFGEKDQSDNTLITVYPLDDDMFAFNEYPLMRKFNPETLETMELVNLNKSIDIITQLSHPHVYDGKFYNCGTSVTSEGMFYNIFSIPEGENKFENIEIIAKIPTKHKFSLSYMHSFGITENYFIIIEQPLYMPVLQMKIAEILKTPFVNVLNFDENENTLIHLIDRKTGELRHTFQSDAFLFFHTINQYEKDGHVVLDIICNKDAAILKGMIIENLEKIQKEQIKTGICNSRALRFVMPLLESNCENENLVTLNGSSAKAFRKPDGSTFCIPEVLCDEPVEFSTIWYRQHVGKFYRYFYSIGCNFYSDIPNGLIKVDVENKTTAVWQEDNAYPSEPIFIPAIDAQSEDDGVVVSSVVYGKNDENRFFLLILDGKSFKEVGRCEFKDLTNPAIKPFHGWFLDDRK